MNGQSTIDILTGSPLRERFAPEARLRKRDCFFDILEWLESGDRTVGVLYGLRETGKATLIGQVINHLQEDAFAKAAYLLLNRDTDMREVRLTMRELYNNGFRLFFIDEATAPKDFIGSAALYSDIYAQSGAKVLLSGTDSLGFSLAKGDSLYDRCTLFHTSFIPYREFERVLDVHDIDKYIEYGGTMCVSGTNYNRSVFRSRESTDEYVDSAIAMNIRHALEGYRDGGRMMNLRELYLNDELTGAINRVVESVNHEFVLRTLLETFRSHDLGSVRQLLNAKDIDSLDQIDAENITARLQYLLQIKNAEDYRSGLTDSHVKEIRSYLKRLDLIGEVEIRDIETGTKKSHDVFMQPGLRYSQAKDLISVVLDDPSIRFRSASEKTAIAAFFEADIKGRMMDEIVLYDTSLRYPDYEVFKLQYGQGEIDMVVYDPEAESCSLYEIKHSETIDARQVRHLSDESLIRKIEEYYGPVVAKNVIYRGRTIAGEGDVDYVNVNDFLSDSQDLRVVFGDNDQSLRFDL